MEQSGLLPLAVADLAVPLFMGGMLAMSTVSFATALKTGLRPLTRVVLAINLAALLFALCDASILLAGGLGGDAPLARAFHFAENLIALAFNPLAFHYCRALLGEERSATAGARRFRAAMGGLARLMWLLAAAALVASLLRPELLVSLGRDRPNAEGLAYGIGHGISGPIANARSILNLLILLWLPSGAWLAWRLAGKPAAYRLFIVGPLFPAWFGVQEAVWWFTGFLPGLIPMELFHARAITGLGLFALLAAVAVYRADSREAAQAGQARRLASAESEERRRAVEGKIEAESRLAQVFDFLPDPTFAIDAAGRVIVWNKAVAELSGVPAEAMLGRGDREYALPFFGERRPILIDLALAPDPEREAGYDWLERRGEVIVAENSNHLVHGGRGAELWAIAAPFRDSGGRIIGAVECIRDITRHKRAERELSALAADLEDRVAARTAELTATRDSLVEAEKYAVVGRLGATIAHELNTPLAAIISTAGTWKEDALLAFSAQADVVGGPGSGPAGPRARLESIVATAVERSWEPGGMAERTLRRELERGLSAAGAARPALAADLLVDLLPPAEARSALAWAASPEGMALLDAASRISLLLRGSSIITEAARKAARVVAAISSFSRREDGPPGPVDVVEAIENLLVLYYGSIKRNFSVKRDWAARDPALGVRDRLDQVWVNLINNALHAMGKTGTLSFATLREGDRLVVRVTDDGCGIPPEIAHRVFEPFFTTKEPGEGTGLGLDAARRIVEGYGGSIGFSSRAGETTFTVSLPLAEPPA